MNQQDVSAWIKEYVARLLGMDVNGIDSCTPFERFGLDSTAAVGLSGDLGELLGLKLDADVIFKHPTIDELAAYVSSEVAEQSTERTGERVGI